MDFNERPFIAIWEVTQACDLMREVLLERLKQGGHLARAVGG